MGFRVYLVQSQKRKAFIIQEDNNNSLGSIVAANPAYGINASEQISNMLFESNQADKILEQIARTAQSDAVKGGFAAETWHAETLNLDAILKGKSVRAFTDSYQNSPLTKNNALNDIVVVDKGKQIYGVQVKYYKDGDATQKAFREMKDGIPKYKESDGFLAPSDQLIDVKTSARQTVLKNQQTRPEVADAAQDVANKSIDKIKVEDVEFKP